MADDEIKKLIEQLKSVQESMDRADEQDKVIADMIGKNESAISEERQRAEDARIKEQKETERAAQPPKSSLTEELAELFRDTTPKPTTSGAAPEPKVSAVVSYAVLLTSPKGQDKWTKSSVVRREQDDLQIRYKIKNTGDVEREFSVDIYILGERGNEKPITTKITPLMPKGAEYPISGTVYSEDINADLFIGRALGKKRVRIVLKDKESELSSRDYEFDLVKAEPAGPPSGGEPSEPKPQIAIEEIDYPTKEVSKDQTFSLTVKLSNAGENDVYSYVSAIIKDSGGKKIKDNKAPLSIKKGESSSISPFDFKMNALGGPSLPGDAAFGQCTLDVIVTYESPVTHKEEGLDKKLDWTIFTIVSSHAEEQKIIDKSQKYPIQAQNMINASKLLSPEAKQNLRELISAKNKGAAPAPVATTAAGTAGVGGTGAPAAPPPKESKPQIVIKDITVSPKKLLPGGKLDKTGGLFRGDKFDLIVTLRNVGKNDAHSIDLDVTINYSKGKIKKSSGTDIKKGQPVSIPFKDYVVPIDEPFGQCKADVIATYKGEKLDKKLDYPIFEIVSSKAAIEGAGGKLFEPGGASTKVKEGKEVIEKFEKSTGILGTEAEFKPNELEDFIREVERNPELDGDTKKRLKEQIEIFKIESEIEAKRFMKAPSALMSRQRFMERIGKEAASRFPEFKTEVKGFLAKNPQVPYSNIYSHIISTEAGRVNPVGVALSLQLIKQEDVEKALDRAVQQLARETLGNKELVKKKIEPVDTALTYSNYSDRLKNTPEIRIAISRPFLIPDGEIQNALDEALIDDVIKPGEEKLGKVKDRTGAFNFLKDLNELENKMKK